VTPVNPAITAKVQKSVPSKKLMRLVLHAF
jgi:hypothetical protein